MKLTPHLWKTAYILLALAFAISYFQKNKLPEVEVINLSLFNEPIQTEIARAEFNFDYRGKSYNVVPQAEYELWGLVVSVNNIGAWFNYYTDEDSVNLKDVCVVWGENVKNGVYRDENINFKSGEFTCYFSWRGKLENPFRRNQLSNNHLLTADEKIQELIRGVQIGDQLHIKGALVDYAEAGTEWYRRTSLSRDDTNNSSRGAGACEVFYVDEMEILKKNQPFWNDLYSYSKNAFVALLIIQLSIFIFKVYFPRKREEE